MHYPDLKKDQAELINSAYVYTLRISKLTQTLLLLTKIANDQFPDKRAINLAGLIVEKIKMFEDHILEKSLKLSSIISNLYISIIELPLSSKPSIHNRFNNQHVK
jgi:hypothetical protein